MGGDLPLRGGFVGRASQLRFFDGVLAAAESGAGELIFLSGEGGIGKTRLCSALADRAVGEGFAVGRGSCWSGGGALPLWPWTAILDGLTDGIAGRLLIDDRGDGALHPERFIRFAAVVDAIAEVCRHRPVLVIIDDAQAADAGAMLLARFIGRQLAGRRLVLVLAYRVQVQAPANPPASWGFGDDGAMVRLGGFDLPETTRYLRSLGYPALDPDLLRVVWRLTRGHPLFIQRFLGHPTAPTLQGHKEAGVTAAIATAVADVADPARTVLSRAAVLGPTPLLAEAAAVAAVSVAAVRRAVASAAPSGLVVIDDDAPGRFAFSHELVREAMEDCLSPSERASAHAEAAAVLTSLETTGREGSGRSVRRARHALLAAYRSPVDARMAIDACRTAAAAMTAGFAEEEAASLLGAAARVHDEVGLDDPPGALLVEWAEAVLACGRLSEARTLFDRAIAVAVQEEDAILLGRAALGLGGVWVNEHRTTVEWERVVGLQRTALASLPGDQMLLRHRLVVRLAVEDFYRGGPLDPVLLSLDRARELGDGRVLAEALSLCHHALLTARHTWMRLALADELVAVAAPAGQGLLALMGLCWRTVDLFHLGNASAARVLVELRDRADALRCQSVLYIADVMMVMLLIRAGRLEEAEARAHACYTLGARVGDADAPAYLAAHLITIRWFQGRDDAIVPLVHQILDSPTLNPADFSFAATAAHLAAHRGDLAAARTALDRLTRDGLGALRDSSTWLVGLLAIIETARLVNDAEVARAAYELLRTYAALPIMPSLAVTCLGSVHRPLGLAAATFGDLALSLSHLEQAVDANRILGNRPATAFALADLAHALLLRDTGQDRRQALTVLAQAHDEARSLAMTGWATAWSRQMQDLAEESGTIERRERFWIITVGAQRAVVPDRLGVRYLAHLLINPGREIPALELAHGPGRDTLTPTLQQPVLDERAQADYRRRIDELFTEIDRADRRGDADQAQALQVELDVLVREIRRSTGRAGRSRGFADADERARTAVRKAIKRAIDEIIAADPIIGDALRATVTTGRTCLYRPADLHPVRWSLAAHD